MMTYTSLVMAVIMFWVIYASLMKCFNSLKDISGQLEQIQKLIEYKIRR